MGNRAPRAYGCRIGLIHRGVCGNPKQEKVMLVCKHGHIQTIWICANHLKTVRRRYLICKPCFKLGRQDVRCQELPLVADLPSSFRSLTVQFDSE